MGKVKLKLFRPNLALIFLLNKMWKIRLLLGSTHHYDLNPASADFFKKFRVSEVSLQAANFGHSRIL